MEKKLGVGRLHKKQYKVLNRKCIATDGPKPSCALLPSPSRDGILGADKTACDGALEEVPIICAVPNLELNVRFFPFREVKPESSQCADFLPRENKKRLELANPWRESKETVCDKKSVICTGN